jgi:LysM repeat protein
MFYPSILSRAKAGQDQPWQEWAGTVAALRATGPAADLVRVAGRLAGQSTATLDTVLDLVAAGQGSDVAGALARDRGDPPDTALAALTAALYALTGHYLVEAGRAGWAVSWTGPSRLIAADIAADELSDLVTAAVHRPATEVARLRLHLASLRLDPSAGGPATSLLHARTPGLAGARPGQGGARNTVRITANADPVVTQRMRTIRVANVVVGVVTAAVAVFGVHAWNSPAPAPSIPPFRPPPAAVSPLQFPNPLPSLGTGSLGTGIGASPLPFPTFPMPKLPLVTSIVVRPGDSLGAVACRYQTTVRVLQRMNHLGTSTRIDAGQRLRVPALGNLGNLLNCQ